MPWCLADSVSLNGWWLVLVGVHSTPAQQAAGPCSQAGAGAQVQGDAQLHQVFSRLVKVPRGSYLDVSHRWRACAVCWTHCEHYVSELMFASFRLVMEFESESKCWRIPTIFANTISDGFTHSNKVRFRFSFWKAHIHHSLQPAISHAKVNKYTE